MGRDGNMSAIIPILLYIGAIFLFSKGLFSVYKRIKKENATRTSYFFFNISNLLCVIILAIICFLELKYTGGDLYGIFTAMIVAFVLPINLALFISSVWMQRSKKLSKPLIAMISFVSVIIVEIIIAVLVQ